MKKKYNFFAFLSRMKNINRWGLMRNTYVENIKEHSLDVAIIAHALAVIKNTYFNGNIDTNKIAVFGIFHDSNETITGDLPTPIKYFNPEIQDAYKKVEDISKQKLLSMLPQELIPKYKEILFYDSDKQVKQIIKAADRICAYIKCIEEEKAGNNEFSKAKETIYRKIQEINLEEVSFFMDNFIEGYKLTLDELN